MREREGEHCGCREGRVGCSQWFGLVPCQSTYTLIEQSCFTAFQSSNKRPGCAQSELGEGERRNLGGTTSSVELSSDMGFLHETEACLVWNIPGNLDSRQSKRQTIILQCPL